ncbi:TPA_exp: putative LLT ORF3 [Suid alphaherpesvirus 1]|uniref:Pseudorabies virus ORF1, ORF2, and ORF3 n=1 Tax=Suid herpesvirus 1 TaxID=10345 RepID=Q69341_SUHV|nr:ORF3 [Suid alphaherpesvirus 1]DAA02200.1 TPA_exp: putative LLT ORF3 [Suid alphaherpesvirus 1]
MAPPESRPGPVRPSGRVAGTGSVSARASARPPVGPCAGSAWAPASGRPRTRRPPSDPPCAPRCSRRPSLPRRGKTPQSQSVPRTRTCRYSSHPGGSSGLASASAASTAPICQTAYRRGRGCLPQTWGAWPRSRAGGSSRAPG